MTDGSRWGGAAGIAAGVLWMIAWAYFTLDELEYARDIVDNPIPGPVGLPALTLAAVATALTLHAVRTGLPAAGVGTKTCFAVAYMGAAISLIPLWPAIFFGPALVALGMTLVGMVAVSSRRDAAIGHRIHAFGLPATAVIAPVLDLVGVIDGSIGLAIFGGILAAGFVSIGVGLNARAQDGGVSSEATA